MRNDLDHPRRLEIKQQTRGERRRRSLRRGIRNWHQDTCARVRPGQRVLLLALTVVDADPMAARGAIRDFWGASSKQFGKRPYFSWAELQRRGAVHYHAILVAPPWRLHRDAVKWIQAHWTLARITPSVTWRDWNWYVGKSGRYVRKYAAEKWSANSRGD